MADNDRIYGLMTKYYHLANQNGLSLRCTNAEECTVAFSARDSTSIFDLVFYGVTHF